MNAHCLHDAICVTRAVDESGHAKVHLGVDVLGLPLQEQNIMNETHALSSPIVKRYGLSQNSM